MKIKEIKAVEGYYLTQVAEVENRMFVTAIAGVNVNEEDWRQATLEEKEAWEKQNNKRVKNEV